MEKQRQRRKEHKNEQAQTIVPWIHQGYVEQFVIGLQMSGLPSQKQLELLQGVANRFSPQMQQDARSYLVNQVNALKEFVHPKI